MNWLRRIRGALGMGLAWAVGWGLVGGLMELIMNLLPGPDTWGGVDMWPQLLAMIGFLGGVIFSAVLRIAAGRRRFDELSLRQFAAWGAVGGALLGGLAVAAGLARGAIDPLLLRIAVVIGPPTVLSALSASGTLALARMGGERKSLDASADAAKMGLAEGKAQGE